MMLPAASLGGWCNRFNFQRKRRSCSSNFELTKAGKLAEALEIQHVTNDLIEGILANGLYLTIKELLKLEGVDAGYCREPMTSKATAEQVAKAKDLKAKFCHKYLN